MSSNNDTYDDDLDDLEVLMARRLPRGKGNFKGKLPIICFYVTKLAILQKDVLTGMIGMKKEKENTKTKGMIEIT